MIEFEEIYLKKLNENIWEKHQDQTFTWFEVTRNLSEKEWDTIRQLLVKYCSEDSTYLCTVTSLHFGFSCGISIYKIIESPYPGIPNEFEHLITISAKHLNLNFNEGWEQFYPFTHHKDNVTKCKKYGMKIPGPKSDYDY